MFLMLNLSQAMQSKFGSNKFGKRTVCNFQTRMRF